jgi:hypothetical protein
MIYKIYKSYIKLWNKKLIIYENYKIICETGDNQ